MSVELDSNQKATTSLVVNAASRIKTYIGFLINNINTALSKKADISHSHTAIDITGLGTTATADLTTSNTDATAGRVLKVGVGGWMGQGATNGVEPFGYPTSIDDATNQTKVIRTDATIDNGVSAYGSGFHFAAGDTWGRLRVGYNSPKAWIQGGVSRTGLGWTSQLVLSDNLLQTTGTSTEFPMSQKAVANAIKAGNSATATKLQTARTITLSGDVSGSASFDGSGNVNITVTVNGFRFADRFA